MSDVVIECVGLGKSYLIGHQGSQEPYTALRDVVANRARHLWNRTRQAMRGHTSVAGSETEEFWALKDVSFDVKRGEVVGIIGRNGAGKSTLLKILSRITEPTKGRVVLNGRVASLLEVGTGFHPELTGRENIFLNGAILGMRRAEIKSKFDEIVAFAEIEKFLDTPVKRYSSGMYVRLAFAVAAHLDPEILIVDEVLAVGDAEFQKKCLGKMRDVSQGGRTVLFVSHNLGAVKQLCTVGTLLTAGQVSHYGRIEAVIGTYLGNRTGEKAEYFASDTLSNKIARVKVMQENLVTSDVLIDKPFEIQIELGSEAFRSSVGCLIQTFDGTTHCHISDELAETKRNGARVRRCVFPKYLLRPGKYTATISSGIRNEVMHDLCENCVTFTVSWSGPFARFSREEEWKGATGPGVATWVAN